MLTTLPRMYSINSEGKCYIKPCIRGLFNTTMKYIFGKDYENDKIEIMCKKLYKSIVLVITSEKILNKTLEYFSNKINITFLEKQFDNITNTNYFENFNIENLNDEANNLFLLYDQCAKEKGTVNCENEWDAFTQYYWSNMFTNQYENLKGFERYQITIEPDMIIQPSFITDNEKLSGTHYIVGGSYENKYEIGIFIETIIRSYLPSLFNNFFPFYSLAKGFLRDFFLNVELLNRQIIYYDINSYNEIRKIIELYSQFNFTYQSLYTIGHSFMGTLFKGASFLAKAEGITFDAFLKYEYEHDFQDIFNILNDKSVVFNQITNIYSSNNLLTGVLPERYILPNVYDTACLTVITCSENMKYVPFCKQVLTENGKNPEQEFNISFDAYLEYYKYKKYQNVTLRYT